jgi:hypothetical protein
MPPVETLHAQSARYVTELACRGKLWRYIGQTLGVEHTTADGWIRTPAASRSGSGPNATPPARRVCGRLLTRRNEPGYRSDTAIIVLAQIVALGLFGDGRHVLRCGPSSHNLVSDRQWWGTRDAGDCPVNLARGGSFGISSA